MEILWDSIPDDQFEEIIAALMRAMCYENVIVRTGGNDDGWDIDGQISRRLPDGKMEIEIWRVECKRYRKSPPAEKIRDHYYRMLDTDPAPDHLLFVTTYAFTNPTKKDLIDSAVKKRVGVHFWERAQLGELIEKYLDKWQLRNLIIPYVELALPLGVLGQACKRQVNVEIQKRVGRKYLPNLFRPRAIERDVARFVSSDLESLQMQELSQALSQHVTSACSRSASKSWLDCVQRIGDAHTWQKAKLQVQRLLELADEAKIDSIKQVIEGIICLRRTCFLIKDKAGTGKTNVLCRLATQHGEAKVLALFLSCRFDLPEMRSLEETIARPLYAALQQVISEQDEVSLLPENPSQLLRTVAYTLQKSESQLIIFLDGINENRDLQALDDAIISFFAGWNSYPFRFVVTCRDIFWGFFSQEDWSRFLFDRKAHDLPQFSETEIDEVIDGYFRAFNITGRLTGAARDKCRHPLLLRFFCEAHRDRDIREYEDLRLKDLFEEYWLRKQQEIAEALGLGTNGGMKIEAFLFKLVDHMADQRATQIKLGKVPQLTGEEDFASDGSIYRRLLDQDIILEELPPDEAFDRSYSARRVGFVYDEFYDYMMALSYVRKNDWDQRDVSELCLDLVKLVRDSHEFEQLQGVIEYLVLFAEPKGMHRELCATLARLGRYEIVCNVLPKFKSEAEWMGDVLRVCLIASVRPESDPGIKKATGWQSTYGQLEQVIFKGKTEGVYDSLLAPSEDLFLDEETELEEKLRDSFRLHDQENTPHSSPSIQDYDGRSWEDQVPQYAPVYALDSPLRTQTGLAEPVPGYGQFDRIELNYQASGGWFSRKHYLELQTSRSAELGVAKAIWSLWKGSRNKIWMILQEWVLGDPTLLDASREILRTGLESDHISAEEALSILETWLLSDERDHQVAAAQLLKVIPPDYLFPATMGWKSRFEERHRNALSMVMRPLFISHPHLTMGTLVEWARDQRGKFDDVIADVLRYPRLENDVTEEFCRDMERELASLRFLVHARSKRAGYAASVLLKGVRDRRSQIIGKATRQDRAEKIGAGKRRPLA